MSDFFCRDVVGYKHPQPCHVNHVPVAASWPRSARESLRSREAAVPSSTALGTRASAGTAASSGHSAPFCIAPL